MWDCQEVLRHGCRAARASEARGCWSVMPEALNGAPLELRCLRQNQCRNISTPIAPCNAATCASTLNLLNDVTDSTELAKKSRLCFERRGALARALARALAVTRALGVVSGKIQARPAHLQHGRQLPLAVRLGLREAHLRWPRGRGIFLLLWAPLQTTHMRKCNSCNLSENG